MCKICAEIAPRQLKLILLQLYTGITLLQRKFCAGSNDYLRLTQVTRFLVNF